MSKESTPQKTIGPAPILRTPSIDRVEKLLHEVWALRCIGVVTGVNGAGKTTALRQLEKRYRSLGLGGSVSYHLASGGEGPSRAVKDLLADLGIREALAQSGMPLHLAIKYALREFQRREILTLLIDDADSWRPDALRGLISMYDQCSAQEWPIAMVLAGAQPPERWIEPVAAATSRALRTETLVKLSAEEMTAVMKGWGGVLGELAKRAGSGDKAAIARIRRVHQVTLGGNFRRLSYLAGLIEVGGYEEMTEEVIDEMASKLGATANGSAR